LGTVEALTGDESTGLAEFIESAKRWRRYLASQTLFERQAAVSSLDADTQFARDWFHSLCRVALLKGLQTAAASGAEQLAFSKALLEEVESVSTRLTVDGGSRVGALREQADSIRSRLQAMSKPDERTWLQEKVDWKHSESDKLERELKGIEEQLSSTSTLVSRTIGESNMSLKNIAGCLPPGTALLDFVQYRRADFAEVAPAKQWKEERYAAYLTFPLRADSVSVRVECVDLGEAAPIDAAVAAIAKRFFCCAISGRRPKACTSSPEWTGLQAVG
jgi:hypothetical protein